MTMGIHHGKHHNAYVTNLNKALEGHADLQALSIDQLLSSLDQLSEAIRTAVRNNGGGHWNHSMFWKIMKQGGGGEPAGALGNSGLGRGTAAHARITGLLQRPAASPDPVVGESARRGLSRIQSGQEIASARSL